MNLLALSLWILDAHAFSWKQKSRTDSAFHEIQVSTVLRAEAVLAEYVQRSDCFRHAAGQIRVRCTELDMDERERVRAAISMTLCELATAKHYSTPLECVPFSVDHKSLVDPSDCVGALSRSAQFWSSYSGYLREIPQLCFAFRRWNDIDTARDVYKNATLEKIELIRALLEREKSSANHLQTWNVRLSELQDVTSHMKTLSDNIAFTSTQVSSRLMKDFDAIRELLANATIEFLRQSQQHTLQQIDASLTDISKSHAHALENTLSYFHEVFHTHLQSIVTLSRSHNQAVLDLATEASDRIQLVNHNIFSLHESTIHLSQIANQTIEALYASKDYMQDLHQAQAAAVLSTNHVVDKITQLTNLTQDEFQRINNSAFLLKQALNSESDPIAGWWGRTWPRLVQLALNIDSQQLAYVPVFQTLSLFMGPLFYIFRSFLSSVMAVFIFLLSSKQYVTSKNVPALAPYHQPIQVHQLNLSRSRRSRRLSRIPDRLCQLQE